MTLPGSGFEPASSERVFNLCVCSPLDNILTSQIYNRVEQIAPNIHVVFKASLNQNTEHQLRYQETEFVISYEEFRRPEFTSVPLFKDEMVLVASRKHPRISGPLLESDVYNEQHAVVSLERYASFSQPWYDTPDKQSERGLSGHGAYQRSECGFADAFGRYCPALAGGRVCGVAGSANIAVAFKTE
nr:probable HTH-type transcriptional regulator LeuO [Salmonella sp. NCTC 7297]